MFGLLMADPGLDMWFGEIDPDELYWDEEEEEEIPEWRHKNRKKMVIRRRGDD